MSHLSTKITINFNNDVDLVFESLSYCIQFKRVICSFHIFNRLTEYNVHVLHGRQPNMPLRK